MENLAKIPQNNSIVLVFAAKVAKLVKKRKVAQQYSKKAPVNIRKPCILGDFARYCCTCEIVRRSVFVDNATKPITSTIAKSANTNAL